MRVDVLTLFPEAFVGPLDVSIIGRARQAGLLDLHLHNPREHATDRHKSVDDYPFGGGQGMVLRVDVLDRALQAVQAEAVRPGYVIYLSPQGRRLDDPLVRELATNERLVLVCGRYEGVDERFVEHCVDLEVSLGDFIVTGGELPAMVLIDAVSRHIPGALGDEASSEEESFATGLLEHPQYTRPAEYRGWVVPEVLLGGHHEKIEAWKQEQRGARTWARRPDLLPEGPPPLAMRRRGRSHGAEIRLYEPDRDRESLATLLGATLPGLEFPDGDDEGPRLLTIVGERKGHIIGAASAVLEGTRATLRVLALAEPFRGSRLAAELMSRLESELRERGCREACTTVENANWPALRFLKRLGWEQEEARVLRKSLDPGEAGTEDTGHLDD